jgi:cobalt-precorrin 5A hydrolase
MRVVLGIGCDRGTSHATLAAAVARALREAAVPHDAVVAVASIDKKQDEAGLLALAREHDWPLRFFPASELARVVVPNPSETVRRHMGTPAVAEAAALLAAHGSADALLVEKLKHRDADGKHATVSIAKLDDQHA